MLTETLSLVFKLNINTSKGLRALSLAFAVAVWGFLDQYF